MSKSKATQNKSNMTNKTARLKSESENSNSQYPLANHAEEAIGNVVELFKKMKSGNEFEFVFFAKRGKYLPQEKYIELLHFIAGRAEGNDKLILLDPEDTLDITYQPDIETNIRCTITGTDKINSLMKKLNMWRNHVVFKTLVNLWGKKEPGLGLMKKEKKSDLMVDVEDLDFRVRLSDESKLSKDEIAKLEKLDENNMSQIKFRYKQ